MVGHLLRDHEIHSSLVSTVSAGGAEVGNETARDITRYRSGRRRQ